MSVYLKISLPLRHLWVFHVFHDMIFDFGRTHFLKRIDGPVWHMIFIHFILFMTWESGKSTKDGRIFQQYADSFSASSIDFIGDWNMVLRFLFGRFTAHNHSDVFLPLNNPMISNIICVWLVDTEQYPTILTLIISSLKSHIRFPSNPKYWCLSHDSWWLNHNLLCFTLW